MSRDIDCWNTVGVRGAATCERLVTAAHCRNCPEYIAAGRKLLDRDIPDGAPEEWARLIAEPKKQRQPGSLSVMIFRIGAEWLALKTILFEQVVSPRRVLSVPSRTNRIFRGLVNVDGELLLCFSTGEALGLEQEVTDGSSGNRRERLLVVNCDGQRFAFAVEEVLGVRVLAPEDLAPVPATLSNAPDALTTSLFSIGARQVGVLDEARLVQHVTRSLTL